MKLSIIITIYNNEDTLFRCVESVVAQNVDNCEIIIIDDGSTDGSGALADKWAKNDERTAVVHKPNGGTSDAKNHALDVVKGDYVTFVDSDDELSPNTLQPLMQMLHEHPEYDILEYSVLQNVGSGHECPLTLNNHLYHNALDWLSVNGCSHCWMWNKIFKRKMFDNLRFPVERRRFEDMWMMSELIAKNPVIATTSHGTYKYYFNAKGQMATMTNHCALINSQMDIIHKHSINTREKRWHKLYMDIFNIQLYVYVQTGQILIPSQTVVPRFYGGIAGLIKSLALDILGLRLSCKLFKVFRRLNSNI